MSRQKLMVYTDGSWNNDTRKSLGGVGVYMRYYVENKLIADKSFSRGFSNTDNYRMEIKAVIFGLRLVKNKRIATYIITDCMGVVDLINSGRIFEVETYSPPFPHSDLLVELLKEANKFHPLALHFIHTKGHGKGHEKYKYGNERADKLASYKNFSSFIPDIPKK